jgi:hypothetical protein
MSNYKLPSYKISKLRNSLVTKWLSYEIFKLWNFHALKFPSYKIPKYQNSQVPKFPSTKIPKYQNSQVPKFLSTKIPKYQNSQVTKFPSYKIPWSTTAFSWILAARDGVVKIPGKLFYGIVQNAIALISPVEVYKLCLRRWNRFMFLSWWCPFKIEKKLADCVVH